MEDYDYLYFAISSTKVRDLVTGAVQPKLSMTNLKQLQIPWAGDSVTRLTIGSILRSLDEKIASNNALSQTLEDIAQTIFKSWFIDFDPVKAKMAGEQPAGMDAVIATLFPDSMEESELGFIPKGWELKKVEEVLKRITVKGLPKSTVLLNLGRTLVLEQGDSVIAGFIDEDADVEATKDSPAFVFGDHTCRMRISTMPFSIFPNTIVLTSELINTYWAFGATWGLQKFETYRRHWMELAYKVLIVPNTEVANVYGEQVKPLFEIIDSLMVQNRVLSALRDDLLPRLISGELQIPEEMLAS
jgi:type I restriction enzyme S subunit